MVEVVSAAEVAGGDGVNAVEEAGVVQRSVRYLLREVTVVIADVELGENQSVVNVGIMN